MPAAQLSPLGPDQEHPMPVEQWKTIADFDDQWTRYTDNSGFYGSKELFADMVAPFLAPEDFRGKTVVDVGSGTGRIVNMLLASGAARVHAVEPGPGAFAALKQNTRSDQHRVEYLNVRGEDIPAGIAADLVVSIGVIHHIEDPAATMEACFRALRPGGKCLVWLYGKEGNEAYLRVVAPLRRITTRLPHPMLALLCRGLNQLLSLYILGAKSASLPSRDYILNVLAPMSKDKRYLVIYDQLNPTWAKYYSRQEAISLLEAAGFVDVRAYHRRGYSWTAIGTRPADAAG
jgi:SAM-dependent methyltransferase